MMETVYNRLKSWRLHVARELNVPSYFILSNAHLANVALVCPRSLDELAACPGLGPKKLAQFGETLLAEVAACVADGLEPGVTPPPVPEQQSAPDAAEIMAALRQELARQVARRLKGHYSAAQVEAVLSQLFITA
ncbi:MAG TPA: HRDC domain-containing protein [Symbiobacteriaceae bacterium]|nr:HRDC domain-containing protein [Symbiobacteriaceae bacterium]